MICPKCQNLMKVVDKNGVHIDQCEACRGIFLDAGELELIAGAETAYYAQAAPPPYQPEGPPVGGPPPMRPQRRGYPDSPRPYYGQRGGHGYPDSPRPYGGHRGHRRRSFLESLFD